MTNIYISIGYNCDPRMYIKWEHNLRKSNGYLSCPFDLCVTPYDSLRECIETNFDYFFDELHTIPGENAKGDRNLCGKGELNIINKYGIIFNHEGSTHSHLFIEGKNDDEFYIRNDFKEFRSRYSKRIENYLNYIKNYTEITFVYKPAPDAPNKEKELLDFLSEVYKDKKIRVIRI